MILHSKTCIILISDLVRICQAQSGVKYLDTNVLVCFCFCTDFLCMFVFACVYLALLQGLCWWWIIVIPKVREEQHCYGVPFSHHLSGMPCARWEQFPLVLLAKWANTLKTQKQGTHNPFPFSSSSQFSWHSGRVSFKAPHLKQTHLSSRHIQNNVVTQRYICIAHTTLDVLGCYIYVGRNGRKTPMSKRTQLIAITEWSKGTSHNSILLIGLHFVSGWRSVYTLVQVNIILFIFMWWP